MDKPIQLIIEDSKNNIVNFINKECSDNKIDYVFLEMILKDIYQEILLNKEKELQEIRQEYENSLKNNERSDK
jgi:glutathionyl-hydroquinone reductase